MGVYSAIFKGGQNWKRTKKPKQSKHIMNKVEEQFFAEYLPMMKSCKRWSVVARLQRFRLLYIPQQTANNYVASCILVIVAKEGLYSPMEDVVWVT